jgi:hypothetical protein
VSAAATLPLAGAEDTSAAFEGTEKAQAQWEQRACGPASISDRAASPSGVGKSPRPTDVSGMGFRRHCIVPSAFFLRPARRALVLFPVSKCTLFTVRTSSATYA